MATTTEFQIDGLQAVQLPGADVRTNNSTLPLASANPVRTAFDASSGHKDEYGAHGFKEDHHVSNIPKLVELGTGTWDITQPEFTPIVTLDFPRAFYNNPSFPAYGQTRYFSMIRTGFEFQITATGTQGVAGALIAVWVPTGTDMATRTTDSIFLLQNAEINMQNSTTAMLSVPYMSTTSFVDTDSNDQGQLVVYVLSPLVSPTGVSPAISVTVFGNMVDPNLQNPRFQSWETHAIAPGPGANNLANAAHTRPMKLSLVNESVANDSTTTGSKSYHTTLSDLVRVPNIIAATRFAWNTSDAPGDELLSIPIDFSSTPMARILANTYQLFHGTIIFRVRVFSSPFHKGRLRLAFSPNAIDRFTQEQANSLLATVHEVGLETASELRIPFMDKNWYKQTSDGFGRLAMFVNNRLQANVNTSQTVRGFITMEFAPDAEFSAPAGRTLVYQGDTDTGSMPETAGGNPSIETKAPQMLKISNSRVDPIKADHMQLSNLTVRPSVQFRGEVSDGGEVLRLVPAQTGHLAILKTFLYCNGEFDIVVTNDSNSTVEAAHSYQLPTVTPNTIVSLGVVQVPPRSTITLTVPYYSAQPVRLVTNNLFDPTFGYVVLRSTTSRSSQVSIYTTFSRTRFYRPVPVPDIQAGVRAAVVDVMEQGPNQSRAMTEDVDLWATRRCFKDFETGEFEKLPDYISYLSLGSDISLLESVVSPVADTTGVVLRPIIRDMVIEKPYNKFRELVADVMEDTPTPGRLAAVLAFVSLAAEELVKRDRHAEISDMVTVVIDELWTRHEQWLYVHKGLSVLSHIQITPDGLNSLTTCNCTDVPHTLSIECVDRRGSGSETLLSEGVESHPGPKPNPKSDYTICSHGEVVYERPKKLKKYQCPCGIVDDVKYCGQHDRVIYPGYRPHPGACRCGYRSDLLTSQGIESNPGPKYSAYRFHLCCFEDDKYLRVSRFDPDRTRVTNWYSLTDQAMTHVPHVTDVTTSFDLNVTHSQLETASDVFLPMVVGSVDLTDLSEFFQLPQDMVPSAMRMLHFFCLAQSVACSQEGVTDLVDCVRGFFAARVNGLIIDSIGVEAAKILVLVKAIVKGVLYIAMIAINPKPSSVAIVVGLMAMDFDALSAAAKVLASVFVHLARGNVDDAVEVAEDYLVQQAGLDGKQKFLAKCNKVFGCNLGSIAKQEGVVQEDAFSILKDFNIASMAAKNCKWWADLLSLFLQKIRNVFCPTSREEMVVKLQKCPDVVPGVLCDAQTLVHRLKGQQDYTLQDKKEATLILSKLSDVRVLALYTQMASVAIEASNLYRVLSELHSRPISVTTHIREEPVGVMVYGRPGQGKSLLTTMLTRRVGELRGERLTTYSQNASDDYMSGYDGQYVHIIDDFLQNRDEADAKNVCQMISSVPWQLNMAALHEKGMKYTSKMVVATTNRRDLMLDTLRDSTALARRFPYQIEVEARPEYKDSAGRLDMTKAIGDAKKFNPNVWSLKIHRGAVFVSTGSSSPIKFEDLAQEICDKLNCVQNITQAINELMDEPIAKQESDHAVDITRDAYDRLFESVVLEDSLFLPIVRTQRPSLPDNIKEWFANALVEATTFWVKYKPYLIAVSAVVAVGATVIAGMLAIMELTRPTEEEGRAYSGATPRVIKNTKILVPRTVGPGGGTAEYQGPCDEFDHLMQHCGYIKTTAGVNHFIGIAGKTMAIHSHFMKHGFPYGTLCYKDQVYEMTEDTVVEVVHFGTDKASVDCTFVTIKTLPFFFKDSRSKISAPVHGKGGYLLHQQPVGATVTAVDNVAIHGAYNCVDKLGNKMTLDLAVSYMCRSRQGWCGGALIQRVGPNYMIVGLHVAGDSRTVGYAVELAKCVVPQIKMEGIVVKKEQSGVVSFSNPKSRIVPSPVHGIWDVEYQPAPLHPNDPRIEDPPENLVKASASKYRVNVFDPCPNVFADVKSKYTDQLYAELGVSDVCETWTEAINGPGGSNPIDMTTSAGPLYTMLGKTKKDLFYHDGKQWQMFKSFQDECDVVWQKFTEGYPLSTIFGANLKDEIITKKKVAAGRTRCIEACDVRYVCVFRRVMGRMYDKIYNAVPTTTGIAVGIDPLTQFADLYNRLQGPWIAIDYSKYDGSLSDKLMENAVGVLAQLHRTPELVTRLHEPVINSVHFVSDERWEVMGGMPSGSPCTSVLNSVCNCLVVATAVVASGGSYEDLTLTTYGDDVIAAVVGDCKLDQVVPYIGQWYGMEATNVAKTGYDIRVSKEEATFLKREFRTFPDTTIIVGRLQLDIMKQKLMWCRGLQNFGQQFQSFVDELVLHGREVYDSVKGEIRVEVEKHNIRFPPYDEVRSRVWERLAA